LLFLGSTITPSITSTTERDGEYSNIIDIRGSELGKGIYETTISFSAPEIKQVGNTIQVDVREETSKIMKPYAPALPVVTQGFLLPFKTKIIDVMVCFQNKNKKILSEPLLVSFDTSPIVYMDFIKPSIVSTNIINPMVFPKNPYHYHIHAGRYEDSLVNYFIMNLFPVQYDSLHNILIYWNNVHISIQYEVPDNPYILNNAYDCIVLSPQQFEQEVKPLIDHKNAHGMKSKLITLNEIYLGRYFPVKGRDKAEKVKYFLQQALDEWGITYVLFVGGRKGGLFHPWWWVPARYSNIVDFIEYSFLSDYYFADIYDANGSFSSWDSNENGIFGEWHKDGKDIIDMYPELSIGRLPCKTKEEVTIMINKIITYENTAYGSDWINHFIGVGGDTFPDEKDNYYEGEMATKAAYGYLNGFNATYLWTSTENFTEKQDIISEVNDGCGLLLFSGHSNPKIWSTHLPNKDEWVSAPNCFEMSLYRNKEKLPIVVISGCWISKFDTGYANLLKGIITEGREYFIKGPFPTGYYTYFWIPKCWSWAFNSHTDGGCIAILGGTGLGYGTSGKNCCKSGINFLELQFFKSYGEGKDILGDVHTSQLIYYLNEFPPMEDKNDCKHIQEFTLLGDPSLKIGGYS
jgi:hypothetical protein